MKKANKSNKAKDKFSFFHRQWWVKFEHNYDEKMAKYLWNEKVTPASYKKTDFIEQAVADRDLLLNSIMFISKQRYDASTQFLTLNSIIMSSYAYVITQTDWFLHLLIVLTFFIISISCSLIWITKIRSCLQFNTACFAAIRQYQKHLPSKPHGDALVKALYESTRSVFSPMLEVESWLPRIFLLWYIVLFIYSLTGIFL